MALSSASSTRRRFRSLIESMTRDYVSGAFAFLSWTEDPEDGLSKLALGGRVWSDSRKCPVRGSVPRSPRCPPEVSIIIAVVGIPGPGDGRGGAEPIEPGICASSSTSGMGEPESAARLSSAQAPSPLSAGRRFHFPAR